MPADLFSFIKTGHASKVKELIDEVQAFYGDITLSYSADKYSRFIRDLDSSGGTLRAKGIIILANSNDRESALIHELLHLRVALRHKAYAFYFDGNYNADFVSLVQNVIEHELIIHDFLELGYPKKKFLADSYNPIDYKREKLLNEPPSYWEHEYLRLTSNLLVIDEKEVDGCRKQLTKVREIAIKKYPNIGERLQQIRAWRESGRFHDMARYPKEVADLLVLFKHPAPKKILSPDGAGGLIEVKL